MSFRIIKGGVDAPPPHDNKVEAAVLGSMIVDRKAVDVVLEMGVNERYFYRVSNQLIFRSILRLYADGAEIDLVTLPANLKLMGDLEDAGGENAVGALFDTVPVAANIATYAKQLAHLYQIRTKQGAASEAIRKLQDGDTTAAQKLLRAAAKSVEAPPRAHAPKREGGTFCRASAASLDPLDDAELALLVRSLRAVRRVSEDPDTALHEDLLAAFVYLVPFENGEALALTLSRGASAAAAAWEQAVAAYGSPDRAGTAAVSQKIIEHRRGGGREDILPISHGYGIHGGCLVKRRVSYKDGQWIEEEPEQLTNFVAWVVAQRFRDDGTGSIQRELRVGGQTAWGEPLPEFDLPAKDWNNIGEWLHGNWGHKVIIFAKQSTRQLVLEAIALFSMDAPTQHVYTHTGWVRWRGHHVYVVPSGVIGVPPELEDDFKRTVSVAVPASYASYSVTPRVTADQALEGYGWLERLLAVADLRITAPLVSSLFLAPLSSFLPLTFMIGFCGPTGSRKSSLVAAALTAYGRNFTDSNLPMSFHYTANRIENEGFYGKDLPIVVDNYAPTANPKQKDTLMRLAHTQGDGAARGRMLDGHRSITSKPIRGLVLMTGEEQLEHHSSIARVYNVPMARGDVRLHLLSEVQRAGRQGKLEAAMTHYISWLAASMKDEAFITSLQERGFELARAAQQGSEDHGRLAAQRVWIDLGLELAKRSHPNGRWGDHMMPERIVAAMVVASDERALLLRNTSVSVRFFQAVRTLINAGKINVGSNINSGHAPDMYPDVFGWRVNSSGMPTHRINPEAPVHMWVQCDVSDDPNVWYIYTSLEDVLHVMSKEMRDPIQDSAAAISAALEGDGMLYMQESERGRGSRTVQRVMPGAGKRRVLRIRGPRFIEALGLDS